MTTATLIQSRADAFLARMGAAAKSLGAKFIEARQLQAERIVNAHLASMDDEMLARLGIDRKVLDRAPKAFYPDF